MSMTEMEEQALRDQISELERFIEMVPLESGGGGSIQIYEIVDGNTLNPAAIDGIKWITPAVTLINDDPDTPGTRGDGMGRARNIVSGEMVMVVHDASAPYGTQAALRAGDFGIIAKTQSSPDGTLYHSIARF